MMIINWVKKKDSGQRLEEKGVKAGVISQLRDIVKKTKQKNQRLKEW